MKSMIYLSVFIWMLVSPSLSNAEDASRLANLNVQTQCAIDELLEYDGQRLFPWELIKDKNFKDVYVALLKREHLKGRWLSTLSGPATKNRLFGIEGKKFLYVQSCKQHECNTHVIYLAFNAQEKRMYGLLIEDGSARWIGNPSVCTKEALEMFAHK